VPRDPIVIFVPRRCLPPDEPYRLLRNPNGSLSIAVGHGTPVTPDFVDLLVEITQRWAASPDDDAIGPSKVVHFQRHRRAHPLTHVPGVCGPV
jgi:hypothetical protein